MPLTDAKIRTLKPKDKPYKLGDFDGLYVTVTPTGSRLWHLKYRFKGKEKRLSLGAYPSVLLADARRIKDEARTILARGEDPGALKQEKKRAERARLGAAFAAQAEVLQRILYSADPIPVSKSTWWQGVKSGRFPEPMKLGSRTTVWKVEDSLSASLGIGLPLTR